jgi:hypothetical protein
VPSAGSAVNQDGRSSSLTAPNGPAQQEVLRAALADGGLTPADLSGLQLHGTGTALGDPIEVGAALQACCDSGSAGSKQLITTSDSSSVQALYLLAAKATVGHAEPAAGATGLIYAAQQIAAAAALPIHHLRSLNPHVTSAIDSALPVGAAAAGGCLAMPRTAMPLQSLAGAERQGLLALGVSAFAFQGTNAHAIVTSRPLDLSSSTGGGWGSPVLPWATSRVWLHPLACTLLPSVLKAAAGRGVIYELQLAAPHMAHTWDHVVAGSALVPGVLFLEMAACAVQQTVASSSGNSLQTGICNATIPAACLLPGPGDSGSERPQVVLQCLVQQHMVRVASSGSSQRTVHLQAQPAGVAIADSSDSSTLAGQKLLAPLLRSLPGFAAGEPSAAIAAATATVAACDSKGHIAASGCAEPAQLDAVLQLAAVLRGHSRPELAAQLQVPAAAELYMSAAAASATHQASGSSSSSSDMLASAAIRPGLSAEAMVADLFMAPAGAAAASSVCRIVGLQARKASAAALVRQPAPAASRAAPSGATEEEEVRYWSVHSSVCTTPGSRLLVHARPL